MEEVQNLRVVQVMILVVVEVVQQIMEIQGKIALLVEEMEVMVLLHQFQGHQQLTLVEAVVEEKYKVVELQDLAEVEQVVMRVEMVLMEQITLVAVVVDQEFHLLVEETVDQV